MIKNKRQLAVTNKSLEELTARLARLKSKYRRKSDLDFYSEATRDQMKLMRQHISDYKLAKRGNVDRVLTLWRKRGTIRPQKPTDLSLGELIALLRISRGHTQADLAHLLGTKQANIARMESRGRLAKKLVRLLPDVPVEAGAELSTGGKKAGRITSAGDGPDGPVALGYVKTAFLDDNTSLMAGPIRLEIESL